MTTVAQAVRQTGDQLRQNDQGMIADYTDRAAQSVEKFSNFLQDRDINEIYSGVQDFARREPVLFLGGAFTLGLLAARFLKSSSGSNSSQSSGSSQYNRSDRPYPYYDTVEDEDSYDITSDANSINRQYGGSYGAGTTGSDYTADSDTTDDDYGGDIGGTTSTGQNYDTATGVGSRTSLSADAESGDERSALLDMEGAGESQADRGE